MMEDATVDEVDDALADVEIEVTERKKTAVTVTKAATKEKSLKEKAGVKEAPAAAAEDGDAAGKRPPAEVAKEKAITKEKVMVKAGEMKAIAGEKSLQAKEAASKAAATTAKASKEGYHTASQGVDTFMNAMIDKSALVTKHWKLQTAPEADSPFFFLSVRHYSLTKMYVLSVSGLLVLVNGKVVYRHTEPVEDKHEVPFKLSGHSGRLLIEVTPETKDKKSKKYTYTLFYGVDPKRRQDYITDTTPVPEELDRLSRAGAVGVIRGDQMSIDGTPVQMYDVAVKTDDENKLLPKRFKDFDTLSRLVRSAFLDAGEEELEKLPKLPGKTFMKKSGDEFVEKRRGELEEYMVELLKVARMASNPDVLGFLGLLGPIPNANGPSAPEPAPAAEGGDDDDDDGI